jgi:hypothetical protein
MISIFSEKSMILNSKAKKRPRNFYTSKVAGLCVFGFWFLVFGLLRRHTASPPITLGMHTRGAQ